MKTKRLRIYAPALLLLIMTVSCIDKDILNISDSVEINSRYSVPVGEFNTDINNYLESLDTLGPSSGDSLYYENILYPIDVSFVGFTLTDSLNFNLIKDPTGRVKSVEFVILIANGYPTPAVVQVYFMSGSSPVDSAFISGPHVINAASVDNDGIVTEPAESMVTISMPSDFNDKLGSIRGVTVKGQIYLTRPDIRWVKFFHDYHFDLHVGARIELLYNTNGS
jgi:hypothetical protein